MDEVATDDEDFWKLEEGLKTPQTPEGYRTPLPNTPGQPMIFTPTPPRPPASHILNQAPPPTPLPLLKSPLHPLSPIVEGFPMLQGYSPEGYSPGPVSDIYPPYRPAPKRLRLCGSNS